MIGASKINPNTDDLKRLYELFDMGLNNSEIHRIYRTNEGKDLSRIHISHIRNGSRWNFDKHSFLMKDDMINNGIVDTELDGDLYQSVINVCYSMSPVDKTLEKTYFISHYKNSNPQMVGQFQLTKDKPSKEVFLKEHNTFIFDDIFRV
jgi:hypothetical protein